MFSKMLLDYGKRFTDMWGAADADELIKHWAREMADYTGPEIKRGLAGLDSRDWPPTLPEFKKLCRPPIDPAAAYYEAVEGLQARLAGRMGAWSHPAIFWAASGLSVALHEETYAQVRVRWERVLSESLSRGEWEPIPAPQVALPAPGRAYTSKAAAKEQLAALNASGMLKHFGQPGDGKQWAERLLARAADGDTSIELFPLMAAKSALGVA